MVNTTDTSGVLHSSLSAGFPALPPACLYTIQTTNEELRQLLACVKGIQQQQQAYPTHQRKGVKQNASTSQGTNSSPSTGPLPASAPAEASKATATPEPAALPSGVAGQAGDEASTATHTCLVFSRWTSYRDIVERGAKDHRSQSGTRNWQGKTREGESNRGKSDSAVELPGSLCGKDAQKQLQRYEACLKAAERQNSGSELDAESASHGHQKEGNNARCKAEERQGRAKGSTSLGNIMRELPTLDPAEFLLLFHRLQGQVASAAAAAASPEPPSLPQHCAGSPAERPEAQEELVLSQKLEEVELSRQGHHSSHTCEQNMRSNWCSDSSAGSRQETGRVGGERQSGMVFFACEPSHAVSVSETSRGIEGPKQAQKNWLEWSACGEAAYDSVGNEMSSKYFLRESLSQQYWKGLLLDSGSWIEMTVEPIAAYMAFSMHAHSSVQRQLEAAGCVSPSFPHISRPLPEGKTGASLQRLRPIVVADGCCGAGGDVRQLSRHFDLVLGVDKELLRIALCRHNSELLASEDRQCAPVFLLHQELQQLAAFRGSWSVRDLADVKNSYRRLTLDALKKHQEALNESCLPKGHRGLLWNEESLGAATAPQAGPLDTQRLPQDSGADSHRCKVAPLGGGSGTEGKGMKFSEATNHAGSGTTQKCLCVPFSRLPCRLCMTPALAVGTLMEAWRDNGTHLPGIEEQSNAKEEDTSKWKGRLITPVKVTPNAFLPIDWLYMSPPWGGAGYAGCRDFVTHRYFLSKRPDLLDLIVSAARVAPNVCLFMPRSTDLHEVFVLAALLNIPLVEVEVLYVPFNQRRRPLSGSAKSREEACLVYPKATIIYLVREVNAWVTGRGVPSDDVYLRAQKGTCLGWRSANDSPKFPQKVGKSVNVSWRPNHNLDFAFCELPLTSSQQDGSPISQPVSDCKSQPPTVHTLVHQKAPASSPLSFIQLLRAINAAMLALRTAGKDRGGRQPDMIDAAFKQGCLEMALAAFGTLCGPDVTLSLRKSSSKEPQHEETQRLPEPCGM